MTRDAQITQASDAGSADSQWLWSAHLFKWCFPASHCSGCSMQTPACRHHPHKHIVDCPFVAEPVSCWPSFPSCSFSQAVRLLGTPGSGQMCKERWLKVAQPLALVPVSLHRKPEGIFISLQARKRRQNKRKLEGGMAEISSCGAAAASSWGQCRHHGMTAQG